LPLYFIFHIDCLVAVCQPLIKLLLTYLLGLVLFVAIISLFSVCLSVCLPVCHVHTCIDVKKTFFTYFIQGTFLRFLTFFILPTFFYFLKRSLKIPSEITFETVETYWVCMIVFLCARVTISISTYILTSIVTYLPYRLTSSDVTRRCVFVSVFTIGPFVPFTPLCKILYASDVNMPSQTK